MNNREFNARFIGQTACGFETGKIYRISITEYYYQRKYCVAVLSGNKYCPYSSLNKVAENWEIIEPQKRFQTRGLI